MQQVADATNVTRATVSLALRAHPSIPAATRARIAECAERLGYRPNPMISALMTNLRLRKSDAATTSIGYLSPFTPQQMRETPAAQRYFDGASRRAQELGYNLDFFCFGAGGLSESRLATILRARAIRGLLIAPAYGEGDHDSVGLPWDGFCAASLGYTLRLPIFNRAVNDHFQAIGLALRKAAAHGYRRVALLVSQHDDRRTGHLWQAGYLLYQQGVPESDRLPVCFLDTLADQGALRSWLARYRPDVAIILRADTIDLLRQAGADAGLGLILLDRSPCHEGLAGVDQRPDLVGSEGTDLVVKRLIYNDHGLPATQSTILIEGEWVDDTSLPDLTLSAKKG
jgi:LacI family transcriptional regulator